MDILKSFLATLIISFIISAIACFTYNYSLRIIFDLPYINVLQMWLIRETIQILVNKPNMEETS